MEVAQKRMRNVHRTLSRPSLLHGNLALLFRTRFRTVCRSQIHISLKIDADAGFTLPSAEQYVISNKDSLCNILSRAHVSTMFAMSRIKFKTQTNFTNRISSLMTYSVQPETHAILRKLRKCLKGRYGGWA
jgi:hypothetical protein